MNQQNKWDKEHLEYYKNYQRLHKLEHNSWRRAKVQEWRKKVLDFLGNKCNNFNCPIPPEKMDKRCLEVDHVDNNGHIERRKLGIGTIGYYQHILRELQRGSKNYQCLCTYCNRLKELERRGYKNAVCGL